MRTWQHDETGLTTEAAESPGARWKEVNAVYWHKAFLEKCCDMQRLLLAHEDELKSAYAEGRKDEAADWRVVARDGLPPCDGEAVFIGINTNGFAACFNAMNPDGWCFMGTAESDAELMSGLAYWRKLDRP